MNACSTPHQVGQPFVAESVKDSGMGEVHGLPGLGLVGAELLGSRRSLAVAKTATAGFQESGIGPQIQLGVFADPPDADGVEGNLFQHSGVGVAAVEGE